MPRVSLSKLNNLQLVLTLSYYQVTINNKNTKYKHINVNNWNY